MENAKKVRVVKREERGRATVMSGDAHRQTPAPAREARDVVSGWVRDHHRRSEEFRRNYSTLLSELGFAAPRAGRGAFVSLPALAAVK